MRSRFTLRIPPAPPNAAARTLCMVSMVVGRSLGLATPARRSADAPRPRGKIERGRAAESDAARPGDHWQPGGDAPRRARRAAQIEMQICADGEAGAVAAPQATACARCCICCDLPAAAHADQGGVHSSACC